jgi:hypothetical protein
MAGVDLKEKSIVCRTDHIGANSKGQYPYLSIIRDREQVVRGSERESGLDATGSTIRAPR